MRARVCMYAEIKWRGKKTLDGFAVVLSFKFSLSPPSSLFLSLEMHTVIQILRFTPSSPLYTHATSSVRYVTTHEIIRTCVTNGLLVFFRGK